MHLQSEASPSDLTHLLDNPAWASLSTYHAHLAVVGDGVRRYPNHLTPIAGIGRRDQRALDELAALVPEGDWISLPATLEDVAPLVRAPLTVTLNGTLVQMVCERRVDVRPSGVELCVLSEPDIADMVALTALTHPGPFRSHTYTLGTYLGIRVGGVLAAMGGQRMHLPGYREVSAICTHPDFRGRGYARTIVARLAAAIFDEGLTPFLHVQEENSAAQAVYVGLGFAVRARLPLVVVQRTSNFEL
jgi:predicted GNAT family acetyltransferase